MTSKGNDDRKSNVIGYSRIRLFRNMRLKPCNTKIRVRDIAGNCRPAKTEKHMNFRFPD